MLVTVTGGTGFVGAHSVLALLSGGHRVRLLVRDERAVVGALAPLGVDPAAVEVRVGDVTDELAVAAALRGADGVLHAASVYSFDSRRRARVRAVNERGTAVVLGAARRIGLDPIVHVSSVGALFPADAPLRETTPVGRPREAYLASKAAAEVIARGHQEDGVPVLVTYPPALLGPHDPKLGDQTVRLRDTARGLMPIWPSGGLPIGDVRDTAALHAALFDAPSGGPGRFFGPGRYVPTREYVRQVRAATGRRLPAVYLPAWSLYPVGRFVDVAQRLVPFHLPAEYGAIYTVACAGPVDPDAGTGGVRARPFTQTVTDTVRWLRETGRLAAGPGRPAREAARR